MLYRNLLTATYFKLDRIIPLPSVLYIFTLTSVPRVAVSKIEVICTHTSTELPSISVAMAGIEKETAVLMQKCAWINASKQV